MHDHFIVKSLNLVRPGGVAAFLTSSFTMDRTNPAARREMHALADLVGAVRLPSGSHRRTAGTEVVTDLLLFRRREAGRAPGEDSWTLTQPLKVDDHVIRVGGYFAEHPDQVLGRFWVGQGMYGAETVRVVGDVADVPTALRGRLEELVSVAAVEGLTAGPRPVDLGARAAAHVPDGQHWTGHISAHQDGAFTVLTAFGEEELPVPATQATELR